jgi:5-methylcytosine-specific restriction endonuclease McrA
MVVKAPKKKKTVKKPAKKKAVKKPAKKKGPRDPTPTSQRDYKKEYARDHAPKKDKTDRAKRNNANGRLKPGKGKEVDHKTPLSKGGSNKKSNLRVVSKTANRRKAAKTVTRKRKTTRKKK